MYGYMGDIRKSYDMGFAKISKGPSKGGERGDTGVYGDVQALIRFRFLQGLKILD